MSDAADGRFEACEKMAGLARQYWLEQRLDGYGLVVLIPEAGQPLADLCCGLLERRPEEAPEAIVLCALPLRAGSRYVCQTVEETVIDAILYLYSLYRFTDRLAVCCWDAPFGRQLANLLEGGVATRDELAGLAAAAGEPCL